MNKKLLALILALCMALSLLTGCSGSTGTADGSAAPAVDERTQAVMDALTEALPKEAEADVVSYLTDGALKADTVIMTAGDKDITAGYYLFWLGRELSSVNSYYQQFGQTLELDAEFAEGQTMLEYLHSAAERYVRTFNAIEQKAAEKGVTLTEEQEKELEEYVAGLDGVSMAYYGTTLEDQRAAYTQNLLSPTLKDKLIELGELEATEETMADYIKDNGHANCRYILFEVASDADKKTDKAQKKKAKAAYDELSKLEGDALLEKFQEYQKENPDGNTNEFSFDNTSGIDEGFRTTALSLKENELGMSDKTGFGYFVILRLPVDVESLKDGYLEETYGSMMEQWGEELELKDTDERAKLDEKAVLTKLMELQSSLNTAAQEASAAYDAAQAAADGSAAAEGAAVGETAADQSAETSAAAGSAEASAAAEGDAAASASAS